MDQTLASILKILEEGKPELKIAASQILGELSPGDAPVARALADRLSNQEPFLTPFVLEALASIGSKEAIRVLVSKLEVGGAVADRVAHLLSQMGPQVTKALAPMFDDGDEETQSRVLQILGRHNDREALTILRKALLQGDPVISERAADAIRDHLVDLGDKQQDLLKQGLERSLTAKSAASLEPGPLGNGLLVLGEIDGPGSRTLLLRFSSAKNDPVVRQSALRALEGVPLTVAQRRTILGYVAEEDMTHVARPAIRLLGDVDDWDAAAIKQLEKLFEMGDEERRLFALRALKNHHTEGMATKCIRTLLQDPPEFQVAAREALSGNKSARAKLLTAFTSEKNIEKARLLAEALTPLAPHLSPAQRKSLVEKTSKLLTGNDPLGEVYLGLIVEADADGGVQDMVDKALRLRRARRLEDCLTILVRLAQMECINPEGRYQLGVARLMMDAQDAKSNEQKAAGGDATMGYFSGLIRDGFPLFDRLKKEGQLQPDDLLRVGRHFATGVAAERRFGGELLHFVAQKHGRRKVGEEAKLMLRTEGL